jgi:hypothetical protein
MKYRRILAATIRFWRMISSQKKQVVCRQITAKKATPSR